MIHQLKIEPGFFEAVTSGDKTFEVRKDDRSFNVGDFLALNEINESHHETGRCCLVKVSYILTNFDSPAVDSKYVVMSIVPCSIFCRDDDLRCDRRVTSVPVYGKAGKQDG